MINAESIARALQGRPTGNSGWIAKCPCPDHGRGRGDLNASLSLTDGEERLLVYCHAGCDSRDVLDELRGRGLLDDAGAGSRIDPPRVAPTHKLRAPVKQWPNPQALQLWKSSRPLAGTLAETYLRQRGILIDLPPSLRFIDCLWHPSARTALPAMLAAVSGADHRVVAVQATFLDHGGHKASVEPVRRTYGVLGGAAVRLGRAEAELGLAEGTESALGAQQVTGVPTWALLGAARLGKLCDLPDDVREIHVFADDDTAGHLAAERAVQAYLRRGLRVVRRLPPDGCGDWADVVAQKDAKST